MNDVSFSVVSASISAPLSPSVETFYQKFCRLVNQVLLYIHHTVSHLQIQMLYDIISLHFLSKIHMLLFFLENPLLSIYLIFIFNKCKPDFFQMHFGQTFITDQRKYISSFIYH